MIKIVKATEEHLAEILRIGNELISPAWTYDFLLNELNKDDSLIMVASDNYLKGFVVMRQVGDDGEILQIAVDKTAQRSGIGDLLMDAALDHSRENKFNSIFLEVRDSNIAAVSLYKKHGFKAVRVRKDYYNDPVEDAIVMKKCSRL